jgi:methyltransferase FkbM-like protein
MVPTSRARRSPCAALRAARRGGRAIVRAGKPGATPCSRGSRGPAPGLLKRDVQGSELEALKGAARVLERTEDVRAETVFDAADQGEPLFDEVHAYLRDRGYRFLQPLAFLNDERGQICDTPPGLKSGGFSGGFPSYLPCVRGNYPVHTGILLRTLHDRDTLSIAEATQGRPIAIEYIVVHQECNGLKPTKKRFLHGH